MAVLRRYDSPDGGPIATSQVHSLASIVSIICAIASFFVHSGVFGLVLAIFAIVLGLVGFLKAASPRVSGGILSMCAIGLGVIAALFAVLRGIMHLF
jgi:hypothetical protein